jgi:sec-independent protein translocase protein TatB
MFEVGFTEIILIVGLALLVLGPEKLPGLVNKIGRWTGRARSMARQLRTQLEHEVTLEEIAKSRPMRAGPASPSPPPDPIYQPAPDDDSAFSAGDASQRATEPTRVDLTKPPQ